MYKNRRHFGATGLAVVVAMTTAVVVASESAWAQTGEQAAEPAIARGDYFVLGLIVFCGALLVLLLRQSGRTRDAALQARDSRRGLEARDLVLSSDRVSALFFETDPRSLTGARISRATPALRRQLALPEAATNDGGDDGEAVLNAFDDESTAVLRDRLAALRAGGVGFEVDIGLRDGNRVLAVSGERIVSDATGANVDVLWFKDTLERDLHARRDLFETALSTLAMPVWTRRVDLELDYRNPAAIALVGAEDPSEAVARRALATNRPQSESVRMVVAGDRRLFEFSETPLLDESGTLGWAMDVTALEATQSDLARLVAAHEEVLEELSTAIAIFGPDKRLGYFNTAFTRLWKVETELLRGEPTVSEFLNLLRERRRLPEQADFAAFRDQWNAMFMGLIDPRQELLFLPDETTLRMLAAAHPNGGLLLTFEDVTDRLVLERSYNILSAVQRETIDNLNDALAVFGSDGRLKLLNPRFSTLWRLPADLSDGEPHVSEVLELMRPSLADSDDWLRFRDDFSRSLASRAGDTGKVERLDGSVLDYALVPLSDGATLVQYWDVTDSIRIQRALQERAEALEQADRLKSEFIANVSYELRTPLNAIIGFSELLKMQVVGPMNGKQIDYAESLIAASTRLVTLVNDILDLASIEAGYLELDPARVDVRTLYEELMVLAQERSRSRNMVLEANVAPDSAVVVADPVRLKQALFNLVSNALQFTPGDGRILLTARREAGATVLEVSDTGVGIPDDIRTRVFESFEKGASMGRSTGAGLGLALVERLIRLHGGEVTLRSDVGLGTVVSCWLPDRPELSERTAGDVEVSAPPST